MRRKAFWQGMMLLFVFLLCFVVVVMVILDRYSFTVGNYLGSVSTVLTSDSDEGLYETFTPDENYVTTDADGNITSGDSKAVIQGAIDQGHREGAEGAVLLKNENNALLILRIVFANVLEAQSYVVAGINIIVMCLLMAAFCNILINRIVLLLLLATYDTANTAGWTALIASLAAMVLYLISAILIIFCAFNKDKRDRWAEKEARRACRA